MVTEALERLRELAELEADIKFEVYNKDEDNHWVKEPELNILEITDIKNPLMSLSYKDYKETIEYILQKTEFVQGDVSNLNLVELDSGKMFKGKFVIRILEGTEHYPNIKLECKSYETAKFENGDY